MRHYRTLALTLSLMGASAACALSVNIIATASECAYNDGYATAYANGGVAPYTYAWSNGGDTQTIIGLASGNYSVTVTDALGATASNNTFVALGGLWINNSISTNPACMGENGMVLINTDLLGGFGPYVFDPVPTSYSGNTAIFSGYGPFQPVTIGIQDVNGCTTSVTVTIPSNPGPVVYDPVVYPACNGAANGSAVVEFGMVFNDWPGAKAHYTLNGPGGLVSEDNIFISYQFTTPMTFTGLVPGPYTVILTVEGICGQSMHSMPFTILDIGPDCGALQGTLWADSDGDCNIDGNEVPLPYRVLVIEPGTRYAITDAQGAHETPLVYGAYTLAQGATDLVQTCPPVAPAPFTIDAITPIAVVDIADSSSIPYDLETHCSTSAMRPGFASSMWITVRNRSMYESDALTLTLDYDAPLIYQSASTPPSVTAPGHLEWQLPVLPGFAYAGQIQVQFTLPPDPLLIGTSVELSATVISGLAENDVANNTCTSINTIVGSYDPNDKQGTTSSAMGPTHYFLDQDDWIDYTVRFQNTGTATAQTVVIRDTIDADLSIPSLEILGASHAFTPSFGEGRELIFTFSNIDLPDSTSDLPGSQGFVSFRIKPNSNVIVGDALENSAGIYFDFNPPIITNTVSHVVELSTSEDHSSIGSGRQLTVVPNPVNDVLNVMLPEATAAIEVLAIDGRSVRVPGVQRADGFQLDVRALPAGLYYVRTDAGTARFVKQ